MRSQGHSPRMAAVQRTTPRSQAPPLAHAAGPESSPPPSPPVADPDPDGPLDTEAYGVRAAGDRLELMTVTLPPLGATQVEVEMSHCGLCHTDLHMVANDWGVSSYPMVPGHEGVGVVSRVGQSVRTLRPGDRVGIGWIRDACGACGACLCGRDNLCEAGYQGTYLGPAAGIWGSATPSTMFGCFSRVMRIEEKFAFAIPANMSAVTACPLLCAGGTVYEAIVDWVSSGQTVGIGGLGGLGTLGLQLCKLHGAKVVVFSGSESKRKVALRAGAHTFICTRDDAAMADASKCDVFLDTVPVNRPLAPLLELLQHNGAYVRVGIPPASDQTLTAEWLPTIFTAKKVAGSIITGPARMTRLFQLAADNLERLDEELGEWRAQQVPFERVNEAIDDLRAQHNSGYRTVLLW